MVRLKRLLLGILVGSQGAGTVMNTEPFLHVPHVPPLQAQKSTRNLKASSSGGAPLGVDDVASHTAVSDQLGVCVAQGGPATITCGCSLPAWPSLQSHLHTQPHLATPAACCPSHHG